MIDRKRVIILVQLTIFLVTVSLLYNTYRDKNKKEEKIISIKADTDSNINSFTDIEYAGFDLNGNRYILRANKANFKTEEPENISMRKVVANFYLKDDTVIEIISDTGLYNNITFDMDFKKNVKATYLTNVLLSDRLIYSNSKAKMIASGNVRGESVEKGEFFADNVEYNLTSKIIDFSMFNNQQVNMKLID